MSIQLPRLFLFFECFVTFLPASTNSGHDIYFDVFLCCYGCVSAISRCCVSVLTATAINPVTFCTYFSSRPLCFIHIAALCNIGIHVDTEKLPCFFSQLFLFEAMQPSDRGRQQCRIQWNTRDDKISRDTLLTYRYVFVQCMWPVACLCKSAKHLIYRVLSPSLRQTIILYLFCLFSGIQ